MKESETYCSHACSEYDSQANNNDKNTESSSQLC